jgi:hypothetical protein
MGGKRNGGLSDFCLVIFVLGGVFFGLLCLGKWSPFHITPPAFDWLERVAPSSDYAWVYDKLFDGTVFGLLILIGLSILILVVVICSLVIDYLKGDWRFRKSRDD